MTRGEAIAELHQNRYARRVMLDLRIRLMQAADALAPSDPSEWIGALAHLLELEAGRLLEAEGELRARSSA